MNNVFRILALALAIAAGYAAPANAVQLADVSVTEYFDPSTSDGYFEVANNSASKTLHYFAVANDSITGVSAYDDWQIGIVARADWEINTYPFPLVMSYQLDTRNFDWVTYFGATTTQVAVYASDTGLAPGVSSSQFGFSSLALASPFVAFDQNGAVMASGATTEILAVPEASSAAMFGVGVLMLVWAVGRRRKGVRVLLAA